MTNVYKINPNVLVAISLPASTWREIERELRARDVWWLANQLVNTGSSVFDDDNWPKSSSKELPNG